MNHYLESRAALITALKSAIGDTKLIIENEVEDAADQCLQFHYLPAGDDVSTLGSNGFDEYTGFAQIDICTKINTGFKPQLDLLAMVRAAYSYSRPLTYGKVQLRLTTVDVSGGIIDEPVYYRRAVSVYFTYRVQRGS